MPTTVGIETTGDDAGIEHFIRGLPKTDLHIHLEGSIEPELMLTLADRNGISLPWSSTAALRSAYHFEDLQSFLDLYFAGCRVLVHERDFYDVTLAYLERAVVDGVIRAELFIGPQSFTERGVSISTLISGVLTAMDDATRKHGISIGLLISAHRHRSEADALALLDSILPWSNRILGVGLGGAEAGNPPSKFERFFHAARKKGFHTTVHAGEEGPAAYVREAIELLQVDRIDHGITCRDDPALVEDLAAMAIPLTVCPLSNLKLKVVQSLETHPLKTLLDAGLRVTINSDDPPYFGGYVSENLIACRQALGLSVSDIVQLARNGFSSAFISQDEADAGIGSIDAYLDEHVAFS
ncbi:MAG: adenosine deaminase [candidate division NC10 bacterium]|nr:adenosine deaminase [candidate division NC10 bacterium]